MSILILGSAFRVFCGATLDCFGAFSVGAGEDVRGRFDRMNLETSSAATSGTSAYKNEDEDMEDAVTSNPGTILVILLSIIWSIKFW